MVAILAASAAPAAADELPAQCSETDSPTYLQDVLNDAAEGDVVTLAEGSVCDPDDAELSEFRLPSRRITLQGNGTGAPEVFDGDSENRTLRGSDVGGTIIRNLTFQDAEYSGSGAAIKIQGNSTPTISNVIVIDSESEDRAPVTIDADGAGGTVTVEDSHFGSIEDDDGNGNAGESGGALHIDTAHAIVVVRQHVLRQPCRVRGRRRRPAAPDHRRAGRRRRGRHRDRTTTFADNEVSQSGEASFGEAVGGGLAIRSFNFRRVTQSGNLFLRNTVIPGGFFFPGPEGERGLPFGRRHGGRRVHRGPRHLDERPLRAELRWIQ